MAQRLRTAVHCIVLGTGVCLIIGLSVQCDWFLHTQHRLHTQHGIQIGVFATSLLTTTPTRITEDVNIRTPERQLRIARIVGDALRHIKQLWVVMIRTVPVGTGLVRDLRKDIEHQFLTESSSQTNGLRIDGITTLTDTMTGLAPPVI